MMNLKRFTFSTGSCSNSDFGWTVKDRNHAGTITAVQTWVTPIEFPCYGVVTHWNYWPGRSAPFRAMVLRNVDNGGNLYDIIGINDIPAGDIERVVTYQVPNEERINVLAGDVIGFAWNSPVPKHVNVGNTNDDDVLQLKYFNKRAPNDLNVGDRIDASDFFHIKKRAYSIQATVSGIVLGIIIIYFIYSQFILGPKFPSETDLIL